MNTPAGTTRTVLHAGGQRSARTAILDRTLAQHWGRAMLVVPTRGAARLRLEHILRTHQLPGALGPTVIDFKSFAEEILKGEGEHPRKANDLRRRMILEDALAQLRAAGDIPGLPDPATGAGLVAHLLEVLTQLKQAALEPQDFRARVQQGGAITPLDAMTAAAYEAYQHALIAAGLYDVPGLYWRAHDIAQAGPPRALARCEVLIFDGFDDFTPSEFRLLTALAPHVLQLHFGVPYDLQSRREELHAQSERTLRRIRVQFSAALVEHESTPCATLGHYAADHLFWRDPPPSAEGLLGNLAIVACIDPQHEAETIARRARALVAGGVAPARIAVVYRNLAAAAPWLRAAFAEFRVPAQFQQAPALAASAAGAFLANVLRATARWEREEVAEILASPLFAPGGMVEPLLVAAGGIARRAMILEGREEWRARLESYTARPAYPEDLPPTRAIAAAVEALARCNALLPATAPLAAHCAAAERLLDQLGVEQAMAAWPAAQRDSEGAALVALRALLGELAAIAVPELSPEDFLRLLEQALHDTPGPTARVLGGVACLDAANARHLDFDYVFFGGLNEGAVPQPAATNAIYNEMERVRLQSAGVELEGRRERAQREMALYHHVLSLPRESLTLLYRLNDGGREAAPSPFLVQTMELFRKMRPEVFAAPPLADSFLPAVGEAASLREVRNAAFFTAVPAREALFPQAAAAAAIERARFAAAPFDAYDGHLQGEAALALLRDRYGLGHVFSVNQLEKYAECPFQFFVLRALRIDEEAAPEAELDHRLRGQIMHRILQRFHEIHRGRAVAELHPDEAAVQMHELVAEVFEAEAWKAKAAPEGVLHAERARMDKIMRRYLAWAREEHGEAWKPAQVELGFGPVRGEQPDANAPELRLQLPVGEVRFSGRIDRVDECNGALRLIDYKSGSLPAAADIKNGISLQLGVYALAAEGLLFPGHACREACFVRVGGAEERMALGGKNFDRDEYNTMLFEAISACLGGIQRGAFPPTPAVRTCYGCTLAHICRHEKARIERKTG